MLASQTCAAVDVEEHVWQLEEEKVLIGEPSPPDDADARAADAGNSEVERGWGRRVSWGFHRGREGVDSGDWRNSSGGRLLAHLGLSSSVAPSR